jgi:hypothetical protein
LSSSLAELLDPFCFFEAEALFPVTLTTSGSELELSEELSEGVLLDIVGVIFLCFLVSHLQLRLFLAFRLADLEVFAAIFLEDGREEEGADTALVVGTFSFFLGPMVEGG